MSKHREFMECEFCSSKTGHVSLCDACYNNRVLIHYLELRVELFELKQRQAEIESLIK